MPDQQSVTGKTENETQLTDEQFDSELDDLYAMLDSYFTGLAFAPPGPVHLPVLTVEESVDADLPGFRPQA